MKFLAKIVDRRRLVSFYPSVTGYGKGSGDIPELCVVGHLAFSYLTLSHGCAGVSAFEEGNLYTVIVLSLDRLEFSFCFLRV